tara:strand:+ start:384 stop:539 length:156 start_codon:yes stop_codon:yes gene_type:complete
MNKDLVTMKFKPEEVMWMLSALNNATIKGEDSLAFAGLYKKIKDRAEKLGL